MFSLCPVVCPDVCLDVQFQRGLVRTAGGAGESIAHMLRGCII